VADALLAPSGKSLRDLQTGLDNENPHAEGSFVVPDSVLKLAVGIEHIKKADRNVVGVIPPAEGAMDEYVVIGAHYDHLGLGSGSNSMARAGEEQKVHHGADDNASGVALVMELAGKLAQERSVDPERFRRGVICRSLVGRGNGHHRLGCLHGEAARAVEKLVAYLNFDMVGRLRENKLTLQGVGSSKVWRRLIEKRNVAAGFNLTLQDDPYLPTDTTSFYPKRVPVLNFFTGAHEDYHRPTDTAEKLDYAGIERIAKFAQEL
jgi:Zn-dependent M28 family amino/carboxypeptidase